MNDRWQKSLDAAVAAYDVPLPWQRGKQRQAMISRRKEKLVAAAKERIAEARRA